MGGWPVAHNWIARHKLQWVLFVLLMCAAFVPLIGPPMHERVFPVITPGTAIATALPDNRIRIRAVGIKNYDCPVEIARIVFIDGKGRNFNATLAGDPNRVGVGPYKIETVLQVDRRAQFPGTLKRTYFYRCHMFWLTRYRFANVPVPRPVQESSINGDR